MACIKELIIENNDITTLEIINTLSEKRKLNLSESYVYTLRRKVDSERAMRVDRKILSTALSSMEDALGNIIKKAWIVINDPLSQRREKLQAMKEIRECYSTMFDKLFDAGVFEKNRGKLKVDIVNPETAREVKEMLSKWGIETDDKPIEIPEKL